MVSSGVCLASSLTRSHLFLDSPNLHLILLSHCICISVSEGSKEAEGEEQAVKEIRRAFKVSHPVRPNVGFAACEQRSPLASGDVVVSGVWIPGTLHKGLLQRNKVTQGTDQCRREVVQHMVP